MSKIRETPAINRLQNNTSKFKKLERHFSERVIRKLDYEDLIKIQKRNLTIVFWDIENSSAMSDMLISTDTAYTELVLAWYSAISEVIFEFDGSVDKFMGDGTMAIFGIPSKDPEGKQDAINAVAASLKARESFETVKNEWNEKWIKDFSRNLNIKLRCGINTGKVFYGNFGTPRNDQLTAIGSEVHVASRLQSLVLDAKTCANRILISRTTESRIGGRFEVVNRGSANLNKILGNFPIYEVIK
jgi:adenylate cyclase